MILLNSDFNETSSPFVENSNVTALSKKVKGCILSKRWLFVGIRVWVLLWHLINRMKKPSQTGRDETQGTCICFVIIDGNYTSVKRSTIKSAVPLIRLYRDAYQSRISKIHWNSQSQNVWFWNMQNLVFSLQLLLQNWERNITFPRTRYIYFAVSMNSKKKSYVI